MPQDHPRVTRKVLTISDVMEMTGRGVSVVGDALRSGALKGVQSRPRASWVITEAAVDAWIAEGCPRYGHYEGPRAHLRIADLD
ncbi:helix-turn-helix domain-containing protein [Gordonia sputi]|uniref:helix-turn-helix domain-containing protein n=1 Tax=Gordonia sputi TaxID=36823 RepID=UPI00226DC080|nr:helix-turn-helix domain-containing protein [Gordonia sputi]